MKIILEEVAPQYTRQAAYVVNVPWRYLEKKLSDWSEDQEVLISPDYQRAHVWTKPQQIKYVEYIMRGGHAGKQIYWNCADWGQGYNKPIELVDGKQRITAVRKFMNNEIEAFGYKARDFKYLRDTKLDMIFYINNLKTKKEVLQWYLDLNEGGTPHTEDELSFVRGMLEEFKR
jgi:uncharacterized protein with ParB-like and HNH nuclease domain